MFGFHLIILLLTFSTFTNSRKNAHCTYHDYRPTTSLNTLTCSDGSNGLLNWNYSILENLYPYVTAWQSIKWNDVSCGTCLKFTYQNKTVYATAVDQCAKYKDDSAQHFDMGPDAFFQLFGDEGKAKGSMSALFEVVEGSNCKGNKKSSRNTITQPSQLKDISPSMSVSKANVAQSATEKSVKTQPIVQKNLKSESGQSTPSAFGKNPFVQSFVIISLPTGVIEGHAK